MEGKKFSKFKLKEKKDGEGSSSGGGSGSAASKYFKPGFIFKDPNHHQQKKLKKEDDVSFDDDDLSETDYEQAIEMASQQLSSGASSKTSQPKSSGSPSTASTASTAPKTLISTSEAAAMERVNQVASQALDFTKTNSRTSLQHIPSLKGSNTILVNSTQTKNPLLQNLRSVRYIINDAIAPAHYLLSDSCCALFLSLKYHLIHPEYIYNRVDELNQGGGLYQLKILLVMVDHVSFETPLKELTILAVRTNFTLFVAWTYDEAARHIENLRVNAEKTADPIMGRFDDGMSINSASSTGSASSTISGSKSKSFSTNQSLIDALTSVKSVNRTDAATLLSSFEKFSEIICANTEHLTLCPGISVVKARRLQALFQRPFINGGGSGSSNY